MDLNAYTEQLTALLPRGRAWGGATLRRLLGGLAASLAAVDARAARLVEEADPRTALETLADWERVVGIPDDCAGIQTSTTDRQLAVAQRIAAVGGQTRAYFIGLAATLGVEVTIEEPRPARVGMRAGQPCRGERWAYAFRVRVTPPSEAADGNEVVQFRWTRAGVMRAGDRLRAGGIAALECLVRRAAPAHAIPLFAYPRDPEPTFWFDFTLGD